MNRTQITEENIEKAVQEFRSMLKFRLLEKGYGTFASRHEIMGVVQCEVTELDEAIEHKNMLEVKHELLDVAVGCVFGVACIEQGTLDW